MPNVTVLKNSYEIDSLYQWDTQQELVISGLSLSVTPEVHFSQYPASLAIVRPATMDASGVVRVMVPDVLLQRATQIAAYVCTEEGGSFKTLYKIVIPVIGRAQPSDYEGTNEAEVYSLDALGVEVITLEAGADATVEKVLTGGSKWTLRFSIPRGKDGKQGDDGAPGIGFASAAINDEGHLIVTRTDNIKVDCGQVTAQVDWDVNDEDDPSHVKNRTHWKEVLQEGGSVLAATDLAFTTSMASLSGVGTSNIIAGKKYTVTWNGTAYECTAFLLYESTADSVTLGNATLLGGDTDTGEPFCIGDMMTGSSVVVKSTTDAETVTVQIDEVRVVEVHHLPNEYLHPSVPWVEEGEVVEILAETTPEVGDDDSDGVNDSFMITETMDLVGGNTYTVTWNGVEYVLVCQDLSELSGGQTSGLILGNTAQLGGTDTGDPFTIMYSPDAMADFGFTGICTYTDGSGTVTYSIKMGSSTVNKLDNRCLDLAWLPVYKQKQVTLYDGTVSLSSNGWRTYDEPLFDPDLIIDKEEYTVTWAGDEYKCVGHNVKIDVDGATATLVFIGNASLGNYTENYGGYTEDTGEPFLYEYFGGEGSTFITFYGNGKDVDIAVTIKGPKLMPNKLPNAFLPDDATVFYLTSPSGTKFAVTVSDDGTLSATEVTE